MSGTAPEPSPLPPGDLDKRRPLDVVLRPSTILHRFFTAAYGAIYFARGRDGRLNAPDDAYGVLYVAATAHGAFAETFLRNPGLTQLPADLLASKAYVTLEALRPLKLVKMSGPGLARIGATAQVVHGGKPYDSPQAWSGALHRLLGSMTESPTPRATTTRPCATRSSSVPPGRYAKLRARPTSTKTGFGTSLKSTASASRRRSSCAAGDHDRHARSRSSGITGTVMRVGVCEANVSGHRGGQAGACRP